MKFLTLGSLGLLLFLSPNLLLSQCALFPINLENRFEHSDLIVEAQVIDQRSFIDPSDQHIYTANQLEVLKLFKGEIDSDEIIIITQGGVVGNNGETVHPSLQLQVQNRGIFFLFSEDGSQSSYRAYSGPQGVIFYDNYSNNASDVFNTYASVQEDLYPVLNELSGNSFTVINEIRNKGTHSKAAAPSIDRISPLSLSAGTKDVLSIYGTGFGSNRGSGNVIFKNASTGPGTIIPVDGEYKLWTDTLIEVEVPHRAGTGAIRVEQNGTDIIAGLEIRFAQLAYTNSAYPIPIVHLDNNGSGGFTWKMAKDFFNNSAAKASYERALASWSDKTCINWTNGSSTNVDADIQDGTNNVRFASSGEMATGVLAHARGYTTSCDNNTAFTVEIDLSYNPDIQWNYGSGFPSFNEYDIESVSVHELGHAHQLGHVVNTKDFMHATIGPGTTKRGLIDRNVEGGFHVMKLSVVKKKCGPTEMTAKAGCTVPVSIQETIGNDENILLFPNPFNQRLNIELGDFENGIVQIFNMSGSEIHSGSFENSSTYVWNSPADMSSGLYLVRISDGNEIVIKRAILSH